MPAGAQAPAVALECALAAPARFATGKRVPVKFALTNRGQAPVNVLTWNTPLEGWFGDFLAVERDGAAIDYRGKMVKRGKPARSQYVRIAPGRTVRAEVDLAEAYGLDQPGQYSIRFRGALQDAYAGKKTWPRPAPTPATVECPALKIAIGSG